MITEDIIKKYKQAKSLDFNMNFLMNSLDKEELDKIAKDFNVSTSELLRILVKEFIKEQNALEGVP